MFSNSTANGLVNGPGVDVLRHVSWHPHLNDVPGAPLDQLPDRLVAVEVGELPEDGPTERERVAAAVLVARHRDRRLTVAGKQRPNGGRTDPRLIAEHQDEYVAARVEGRQRGGDGRGAALAVLGVLDDVGAAQVDLGSHVVRRAPERDHELVEAAGTRGVEHMAEQRGAPVWKRLLWPAEAAGAAGGQHQAGYKIVIR